MEKVIEISRREVLELDEVLKNVGEVKGNFEYSYGTMITSENISNVVNGIRKAEKIVKYPENYLEFEKKRLEICAEMADRDKNGKPKQTLKTFIITERVDEFNQKIEELRENSADALRDFETFTREQTEFLDQLVKIEIYTIPKTDFPNGLTQNQLKKMRFLIEKKEPDNKKNKKE